MSKARDLANQQLRSNTATGFTSSNPVLRSGEIGFETDTKKIKIGDGATAWISLAYNSSTLIAGTSAGTGFPTKANYAAGDILTAANMNDLSGTVNYLQYAKTQNPILNSQFNVWQRGTSVASAASTNLYTTDRWKLSTSAGATYTTSRQATNDTTNLPNIQYCARVQRDSGQTGVNPAYFIQGIETINSIPFAGKTVTLSFYARAGANFSSASSALGVRVAWGTETDQDPAGAYTGQTNAIDQTATLTTTWQRFSYTGTIGATATEIKVFSFYTPVGTASANDYYEITGVQLELGSVANTYQPNGATYQAELAACQRYYVRWGGSTAYEYLATGIGSGTTTMDTVVPMPVTMRVAPTSIDYSTLACYDTSGVYAGTNFTLQGAGKQSVQTRLTVASGLIQYRPYFLITNNSTSGYIGFNAEL